MTKINLTLAHSPDPDDVFMWWPLTGKIDPRTGATLTAPALDTGRFSFTPVPADIELLNKRAIAGKDLYDITALSFRAYADVQDRYILTAGGSSFGDGYGPKVVCRKDQTGAPVHIGCEGCLGKPGVRFAVPGMRTTAFMLLGLVMGPGPLRKAIDEGRVREVPFERVIPTVASGEADVGLVIHEGQITFADAGLRMVIDVGDWWKEETGLPLPLGANAIRRDLDAIHGAGTVVEVEKLLAASIRHAVQHREESVAYTLPFALANVDRGGHEREKPTLERVSKYIDMYVNAWTMNMGVKGVEALRRLYETGASAGLCPLVTRLDPVGL